MAAASFGGEPQVLEPSLAHGMAELAVLEARGFAVPQDLRERVLACTDIQQLEQWVVRAALASSVDEVFAG